MTFFRHRISGPGPAGDIWNVTLHSQSSQTLSSVHAAFVTFAGSFYNTTMAALWSTELQATSLQTDELDALGHHNVAQDVTSVAYKGTGTGAQPQQRSAVVCGLRTATPTRAGRGRMYVPAPDNSNLTADGLLSTTVASSIASALGGDLQTMSAVTTPIVFHRWNPADPEAAATGTAVTRVTVGVVLGTQRRRTNKVPADYQSDTL